MSRLDWVGVKNLDQLIDPLFQCSILYNAASGKAGLRNSVPCITISLGDLSGSLGWGVGIGNR